MNIIDIKNLGKSFGQQKVLNDINLEVRENEILGFIGRNGAGKSTLINIMTGLMEASYGEISIFGKDIEEAKKFIGVMSDVPDLYSNMKIKDFLRFMGSLKLIRLTKKDIKELLNRVGLNCSINKKIKDLSFGMKKKLNLAQTLLGSPKLLILDEPTSGIDPESAIKIKKLILELREEGKTIFFTSHNLSEIEKICDRVAILKEGTIADIGTVLELRNRYTNNIKVIIKINYSISRKEVLDNLFNYSLSDDNHINFEVSNEKEIFKKILLLIQNNFEIYSVKQEKISLEEIFLNI